MIDRRALLAALPLGAAWPALGQDDNAALEAYEAASGGRVGLYAENLVTGRTLAWRADERFVMCSTFKASLAGAVLYRVDRGAERLDRTIRFGSQDLQPYAPVAKAALDKGGLTVAQMCKGAVELSDNTCANLLLDSIGGPQSLTGFWGAIGDRVSRLDHNEPLLNRSRPGNPQDTTSPRAMAGTVRALTLGHALTPASRDKLTGWMIGCQTGANRLRAGLPKDWTIGDKTGNNGEDACGDIAVAWPKPGVPIVIAVYVQGGKPTPAQQDAVFAEAGRLIGRRLGA